MKVSVIIAVLDSQEVCRRQLLHFKNMNLPWDVELIIVDDGSEPALEEYCAGAYEDAKFVATHDERYWSQPCARNEGAKHARGEFLLFTDIDHILTFEAINMVRNFDGDKLMFPRQWAILNEKGDLVDDFTTLKEYGLPDAFLADEQLGAGMHLNTFAIRKTIFEKLNGYDEKYCGKYGGDDTDFAERYRQLHIAGEVKRHVMGPAIGVYPDPRRDVKNIFHNLRKTKE